MDPIICSEKRTIFWERSSRKSLSFEVGHVTRLDHAGG